MNIVNATVAGDKLSFTHTGLAEGDLVHITYEHNWGSELTQWSMNRIWDLLNYSYIILCALLTNTKTHHKVDIYGKSNRNTIGRECLWQQMKRKCSIIA